MASSVDQLLRQVKRQGFTVEQLTRNGNGHIEIRDPSGRIVTRVTATRTSEKALHKVKRLLRSAGAKI